MAKSKEKTEEAEEVKSVPAKLTELEQIQAEINEIAKQLPALKMNDPEQYDTFYKRFTWLVERRELMKGNP